jgi:regulatory protein YycI of two-component signal transduction system YycFG
VSKLENKDEPVATLKVTFPTRELRDRFKASCALNGKNMNEAIIEFVVQYVENGEHQSPKKGKDTA